MIEPKKEFMASPHAKVWSNVTETAVFTEAVKAALLQHQLDSPEAIDPQMSHAHQQRLIGARQFVRVLSALADPTPKPSQIDQTKTNLKHDV